MMKNKKEQIFCLLSKRTGNILQDFVQDFRQLQEIRLREERPLAIRYGGKEHLFLHNVTKDELHEAMEYIADYSLYAYEHEMRQGFLTVQGGHRVGIAGKIVTEEGRVKNFQYISSINIRISHEIKGCADSVFPAVLENGKLCHTLIISPPGCGKTTLLRDMVRQISDGNKYINGRNTGVVDERSEIGGCYQGVPQNQIGKRTDILDNCPKAEGMMLLIRSMSPEALAVDEIGTVKEVESVLLAMHCGVVTLATVHGTSLDEIREKPLFQTFLDGKCFRRYVVLDGDKKAGTVEGIYDGRGIKICT